MRIPGEVVLMLCTRFCIWGCYHLIKNTKYKNTNIQKFKWANAHSTSGKVRCACPAGLFWCSAPHPLGLRGPRRTYLNRFNSTLFYLSLASDCQKYNAQQYKIHKYKQYTIHTFILLSPGRYTFLDGFNSLLYLSLFWWFPPVLRVKFLQRCLK